jgi:hypothetical protein
MPSTQMNNISDDATKQHYLANSFHERLSGLAQLTSEVRPHVGSLSVLSFSFFAGIMSSITYCFVNPEFTKLFFNKSSIGLNFLFSGSDPGNIPTQIF